MWSVVDKKPKKKQSKHMNMFQIVYVHIYEYIKLRPSFFIYTCMSVYLVNKGHKVSVFIRQQIYLMDNIRPTNRIKVKERKTKVMKDSRFH